MDLYKEPEVVTFPGFLFTKKAALARCGVVFLSYNLGIFFVGYYG